MNIKINKDFKEYKNEFTRGFTLKEALSILISLLFAGGITFCLWKFAGMKVDLAVYIAVPSMVPILALAFYKYQGMSVLEFIREVIYTNKVKELAFEAGEQAEEHTRVFSILKFPYKQTRDTNKRVTKKVERKK